MRATATCLWMALALVIGWGLGIRRSTQEAIGMMANGPSPPTIQQIQALAQLVTVKVNVSDVIESRLGGSMGSLKVITVVYGTVLISTDLSQANLKSVDESARKAVLLLPQPRVLEASIDHYRTHIFAVTENGLWSLTPGDDATSTAVVELAYRDAQRCVDDASKDESLVNRAREQATQVLAEVLMARGWRVVVKWAAN